ncbi:MAG: DUF3786 domain-containing protein [Chloroflexota bacterium]
MDKSDSRVRFQPPRSAPDFDLLAAKADDLRAEVRLRQPASLAVSTATEFTGSGFRFDFWGQPVCLTFPELRVSIVGNEKELPGFHQTMVLYYFATCDGTPLTGEWVSFADLPDGRMYNTAFQGYTGREVVKRFRLDIESFRRAAVKAGGEPVEQGNAAYRFLALPRVPLLAVYWLGDEDFPSNCQVLFDASASHCLPTDACALLGSALTRKLLA